jgi:hypothetical protein
MEPDENGPLITVADLAAPADDTGGGDYEQYIGPDAPPFDPFADYPESEQGDLPELPYALLPAQASASLAHNLDVRRHNVWACWGNGIQVGWIGDASHQSECSDHNKDSSGVVHAIDVMVTGSRAQAVVDQCLAHPGDLQYVIHNRTIWSATTGWKSRAYTGSDPHTNHVHVSGKHGDSHKNGSTCVGYDLAAQNATPTFNVCAGPSPKPPAPGGNHAPGTRELKQANPQMTGDDVLFVQTFIGPKRCGPADKHYGPNTVSGVKWYQKMRGITADGVVGPKTWAQMGVKWRG